LTYPAGPAPVVAAIVVAATAGGVVSIAKVWELTGDWTFDAVSVARAATVYVSSEGKLDAAKAYVQADVPLAAFQTGVALKNELPFQ
jgi:hypothetical protein